MQKSEDKSIPDKLYFKIGEVSKLAGVNSSVIRFWEKEFKEILPVRTSSSQRLYNKKNVEFILTVKELLYDKKFTIAGAKKYIKNSVKKKHKYLPEINASLVEEIRKDLESIKKILDEKIK